MESMSLSASGISSALKDTSSLDLINKTLSKQQEMSGQLATPSKPAASVNINVNEALGKGTQLDITV
ncbi:hypothetical protein LJC46_01000 [Desulfovibrio sp. OttesenSCG-928-G15]|nr:hypothetical protein [Desulfovibrio sp. OttesenSCG-928-G15]